MDDEICDDCGDLLDEDGICPTCDHDESDA